MSDGELSLVDEPIAFVDVETTGGHPAWHRITEIAIVAMRDGQIEWRWSSLVNPGVSIPPSIQRLTGISNDMVAEAPSFEELSHEVLERLKGRRFVAHNVRFDYGFVRSELRRAGYAYSAPLACTVRLSRELFPEAGRHNLDAIIERHGLQCETRHRALPDADVLAQLWQHWRSTLAPSRFADAIEHVGRRPSLPSHLPPDLIDDVPEVCGVYRFIGEGDALIYVGKAKNIRERVLAHFGGATRDSKSQRLAAQVRRIDWTETAGELGALLLEAQWVRESKPVYNRRLRGGGEHHTWFVRDDGSSPVLQRLEGPLPEGGDCFGLFRTVKAARTALTTIARESRLCLKTLGLETGGTGSCFGYQLGRCEGACVGSESLPKHALRLKLALAKHKLKSWPYAGPIRIEERNAQGRTEWHHVDRWQYLGTRTPDGQRASESAFDPDIYRILVRHLRAGSRFLRITTLDESGWMNLNE